MRPTLGPSHTVALLRAGLSQRTVSSGPLKYSLRTSECGPSITPVRTLRLPAKRWNAVRGYTQPRLQNKVAVQHKRTPTATSSTVLTRPISTTTSQPVPYSALTVGVPRETFPNERRVAITPQNVALLLKKGFARVLVEHGAGSEAQFSDHAYEQAGATLAERQTVWAESDIVLKVRAPSVLDANKDEPALREGGIVISFIYPAQNKGVVDMLASRHATSFAMDMIPRLSRAQGFDALSSMANIAGYKAIIEASNHFGRFFTGQVTAAGKIPPSKVLVIGAGVAGLSAISTARRLGAIVRGFDTRAAAREQVQSLGADFLEVDIVEEGSGTGGYGREMSKEFIEAEMKLFMEQCRDVDIVVTTALIPGRPAPKLIKEEVRVLMRCYSMCPNRYRHLDGSCYEVRLSDCRLGC